MKHRHIKYIFVLIFTFIQACSSPSKLNTSEIEQGQHLDKASPSYTGQFFYIFALQDDTSEDQWKVLYEDSLHIYFGKTSPKIVESQNFFKISITELRRDIPFFRETNWNKLMIKNIDEYFSRNSGNHDHVSITSARIISRGSSINYQIEAIHYLFKPNGTSQQKALILMDKRMSVLETFYLNDK